MSRTAWTKSEDAILRAHYRSEPIEAWIDRLPGRTAFMVKNRAHRIGVCRPWKYSEEDIATIRLAWGSVPISLIAKKVNRRPATVYWYAIQKLGLRAGIPQGYESIQQAAERTGYSPSAMRNMLRADGHQIIKRPTSGVKPPAHGKRCAHSMMMAETYDVDSAVEWFTSSETLEEASRRTGYSRTAVRRYLAIAGVEVVPRVAKRLYHRFLRADVDRAVKLVMSRETITDASSRTGVSQQTLAKWLREEGLIGKAHACHAFRLDPAVVDDVVARRDWAHAPGEGLYACAERHGVHPQTLLRWLEADGIARSVGQGQNRYRVDPAQADVCVARHRVVWRRKAVILSAEQREQAARRLASGERAKAIARDLGVSHTCIGDISRRLRGVGKRAA